MENRIVQILKLCMMGLLLVLAYILPGICMERHQAARTDRTEKKTQEIIAQEVMAEKQSIVLDPGHGGNDPGMVGIGGIEEKTLNLELALSLKALLEKEGFQVVMTRETDESLADDGVSNKKAQDMQRRCALIEEAAPALTVSIHQNSYTDPAVCGPQVFYYAHSAEGESLASCVQEQLNQQLEIKRPREIKANTNYYILKRSSSVTVLVECAFLSNPEEAALIQTKEYQQKTAEAIRDGILEYLNSQKRFSE